MQSLGLAAGMARSVPCLLITPGSAPSAPNEHSPGVALAQPHHRTEAKGTLPDATSFYSDGDGEFIHMDDTAAVLLGLRGNE